jgi:threonyl-tRNA synthetase
MGPHVRTTGIIKAFAAVKASSAYWLGQAQNDPLQRVYGISFFEKSQLKQWRECQEKAKQRDHRLIGTKQELFFFHSLSPGSCFWLPHGSRIYNKLISFLKEEYWRRGYEEVVTPNIFNLQLWQQSGHAMHYRENMFIFDVEGAEWGMKPMNCPAHCLMFAHRIRSYRELPLRLADFGALHRNELSGALTGLTRVRRFQQDDAHIFCRADQIKDEIIGALSFMKFVYTKFGLSYKLELSTRPKNALGDDSLWDRAEKQLSEALTEFVGEGNWRVNPGDGAFYGPKIDIKLFDALERIHQCATVQLDFQLPIRFNLDYKAAEEGETSFQRPIMIHRAILGSVERMTAILTEHWGGKWPFWISPRQCIIVPVDLKFLNYAFEVQSVIHNEGYFVDVDDSSRTLAKKVFSACFE